MAKRVLFLKLEIDVNSPNWEEYKDSTMNTLFQEWLESVQIDLEDTKLTLYSEQLNLDLK